MLKLFCRFFLLCLSCQIFCASLPVYIAGTQGETGIATLWITDTLGTNIQAMPIGDPGFYSEAHQVIAVNNKLCCVGVQYATSPTAMLWITDLAGSLLNAIPLETIDGNQSYAYSISAQGNQLFCVGQQTLANETVFRATLWITDTSGVNPQQIDLGQQTPGSEGNAALSASSKVFSGGAQRTTSSPWNFATLWVTDLLGDQLTSKTLGTDTGSSLIKSIAALGDRLFCAGMQNDSIDKATVWITDFSGNPIHSVYFSEDNLNSQASCIATNTLQFFIGGQRQTLNSSNSQASLWITDTTFSNTKIQTLVTTNTQPSNVNAVASANNKIYCVGQQGPEDNPQARLWITEEKSTTTILLSKESSNAFGIYIHKPPEQFKRFSQALSKFSPVDCQKGV